jgi:hypothetical protein
MGGGGVEPLHPRERDVLYRPGTEGLQTNEGDDYRYIYKK